MKSYQTTKFPSTVKSPADLQVIKPGSNNAKLGFKVTKGKWKGYNLYSVTLVERDTCPKYCHHWNDCYGNNLYLAQRFKNEGLLKKLEKELEMLIKTNGGRIAIRLHVLGDFFSTAYVKFWSDKLKQYPTLRLFGYTARKVHSDIGKYIGRMNRNYSDRCLIRHSGKPVENNDNWSFAVRQDSESESFICPEQTGKVKSCASCGLCWTTKKSVKFLTH